MNEYFVHAPFAQENYNEYKCGMDKWNRALLEYYHPVFAFDRDVMYSAFFIHAFTPQAWVSWQGVTGLDCPQLLFRKRLLQQLAGDLFLEPPEKPLVKHYPRSMAPVTKHCSFCPNRSRCSYKCYACDKWGCLSCLEKAHFSD